MKKLVGFLLAITAACLIFGLYCHLAAPLSVQYVSCEVTPASEMESEFYGLRTSAQRGEAGVELLSGSFPQSPQECFFLTLNYEIRNYSPLPAEWVTLSVYPEGGDLVYVSGPEFDVGSFGQVNAQVVLLVKNGGGTGRRGLQVRYYSLGDLMHVETAP